MEKFDLCVIGGGPSGYAATMRAMDFGKKVLLVEKDKIGGAGIINGALSSKTLWELSERYKFAHSNIFGFTVHESSLQYSSVIDEMHKAVEERYSQLMEQIIYYVKEGSLVFHKGEGQLISKNMVLIKTGQGDEVIETENIILAAGSRPRYLPSIPIDEKIILTSDGISNLEDFPKSMVILGAGVIGCEFATIFSNFGKTKVFLIDKAERILPFEDEDLAKVVGQNLEKNGVTIHRGASLDKMDIKDGIVEYQISYNDGRKEIHRVEKALISVGRVPNTENLGLEKVGIEMSDRGFILDKETRTNVENIYAVGDFTADIALVNVAELEGRHAVEKIFGNPPKPLLYNNVSTIMFLSPIVAAVGLNEQDARRKNIPYKLASIQYRFINRAIAMRNTEGFIKLLVTDDDEMRILGMRVLGPHASSTIEAVALMISLKKGIHELAELIHPHPSITEGIQECVRMLLGNSILKPKIFNMDIKCYKVNGEGLFEDLHA